MTPIPQYEIDWGEPEAFALVADKTQDGERIAKEKQQQEQDRRDAEKGQGRLV